MRWMDELRARLGPAPRPITPELEVAFRLPGRPGWMKDDDGLVSIWSRHEETLRDGRVALGQLYMANTVLFADGDGDAPAGAVYIFDPVVDRVPEVLSRSGQRLYALHGGEGAEVEVPREPRLRAVLDEVYSGYGRGMHVPLPPALTEGYLVYESAIMVFRDHLPHGKLDDMLVPLLVHRGGGGPHPALIVPSSLWPGFLRERWTEAHRAGADAG